MKCLSLRQSYANLLVSGRRTIEVRKWNTNLRGKFPIPTSKNVSINKDPGRNSKDQDPPMQWVLLVVFHLLFAAFHGLDI